MNQPLEKKKRQLTVDAQINMGAKRIAAFCVALLSVAMLNNCAQAETAPAHCRYTNFVTFPIKFSDRRLTIEGSVNDSPATMLVDTGSSSTDLTRLEAQKLGLKLSHSDVYDIGVGGESTSYLTLVDDIAFGKLHWHHATLGVIWDMDSSLAYSALVGADILFYKDIEISLARREIKFFEADNCDDAFLAYWEDNASEIPLTEMAPDDHRQLMSVMINGQKMRAIIDSGAPMSIINLAAAARAGVTPQSPGVIEMGGGGGIGKHQVKDWLAPFESFTIGGETIKHPKIRIKDLYGSAQLDSDTKATGEMINGQPDMLLGADFLRSHRVLFALSQRRLYFSYLGGTVFDDGAEPVLADDKKPK
jgi:predicted aspartyl protease